MLLVALSVSAVRAGAQQAPETDVSLDSLLGTRISAASKYAQTSSAAPGSVTIVSSDDIRSYGYRNLHEVLESVRGFYVSNDRSYPYLGVRGFSRGGDYNSRVLLLVDGHALTDPIWGAVPVGTDLPLNLDAVDRIEIVQGPGSALYGTGAMFSVINIVTRTASAIDGGIARVGIGSFGERTAALTAGHTFASRLSLTGSTLLTHVKGGDHYYPEFDSPDTQYGMARGLDWERGFSAYGTATWRDVTARTGFRTRSKGVPTGVAGTLFGDPRTSTTDDNLWADVSVEHAWSGTLTLSGRLFADRAEYAGVYAYDTGPVPFTESGRSTAFGTELMLHWEPVSRLRVTLGSESKLVTRAEYQEHLEDGTTGGYDTPFEVYSVFAQGEAQLVPSLLLVAGARVDRYSTVGSATTPRLGLILTPSAGTTVKLLYGEAFRAPNASEAVVTSGIYVANPDLTPERIATAELAVQQRLGDAVLLGVSGYRYEIDGLIDEMELPTGEFRYENLFHSKATGVELQLDARPAGPLAAQLTYALQYAEDAEGTEATNSPRHVANLGVTGHASRGAHGAVRLRYESGRRSIDARSPAFLRTDANVGFRPGAERTPWGVGRADVSLRVTNLFNVSYAAPVGVNLVQDVIAADGRTYALRVEWHF